MTKDSHHDQSDSGLNPCFDDLVSSHIFSAPETLRQVSTWHEHIPFAFGIVQRAAPDVFVELGTYSGTSYLAFCQAVKSLGLPTRCYGVDGWNNFGMSGRVGDDMYRSLVDYNDTRYGSFSTLIRGSFDEALARFPDGSVDILHIDGEHSYASVRRDFETWKPKLSSKAVVLFHDCNVREPIAELGSSGNYGVYKLWSELTPSYPDNFRFLHGYGLGVLGVGAELPAPVRRFLRATQDPNTASIVRSVYGRLGSLCSATLTQTFVQNLLEESLAAQKSAGEFTTSCGANFNYLVNCVPVQGEPA